MKFTFGICSNKHDTDAKDRIARIVSSIQREVPNDCFEIILVGGNKDWVPLKSRYTFVDFDENTKYAWITRKKNTITSFSSFENVVYMHDYLELMPGWYAGWIKFGDNFNATMNKIENSNGERYRDWTLWVYPEVRDAIRDSGLQPHECGLPYEINDLSRFQYFSGAYWVAKKSLMNRIPLDENRSWGQGEDVEWSTRFTRDYNLSFSMNPHSTVQILKPHKGPILSPMPPEKGQEVRKRLLGC